MSQALLNLKPWIEQHHAVCLKPLPVNEIDPQLISTDTREIKSGSVFIPLVGDKFDGHAFLSQAFEQGASLAFCAQNYYEIHQAQLADYNLILVEDTLLAYQRLATAWRRALKIPVIAITGSSGKTSTKEILNQVLVPFYKVHRTEANFNNQIGVPKTLLTLRPEHQVAIVEMGMRGLGQIAELCDIAEPDYGIITNIGPVHLSELGSIENIIRAKWELADYLQVHQGTLAINHENQYLRDKAQDYRGQLVKCGKDRADQIQLIASENMAEGQKIDYRIDQSSKSVYLDLEGEHQALNLLCCIGILNAMGRQLPDQHQLAIPRLFGRQQKLELAGRILTNDAYNANPDSMKAALSVLAQSPGRRIAVLGKMAELGPDAQAFHQEIGRFCENLHLDAVYVLGAEAKGILDGIESAAAYYFDDRESLVSDLKQTIQRGDTVLFKASRSASLEEVFNPVAQYFSNLDQ